jgi:hypothetical protein
VSDQVEEFQAPVVRRRVRQRFSLGVSAVALLTGITACSPTSESEPPEQPDAAPSPPPTESVSAEEELRRTIEVECAADLADQLGLEDPADLEFFDLEEPTMSEDLSLLGLEGMARYPTASGVSTTSDRFNCAILLKDSGDITVSSYTY